MAVDDADHPTAANGVKRSSEAKGPLPGEIRVGEVFGNAYRVVRLITAGGMGAIYEVVHLGTRRRRALKVLLPALVADPVQRKRFESEATVTADVKSEHLVEVFDAGIDTATGMPFLVMELLDGEDLSELVARRGRLEGDEVVDLLAQVASALDKTHAAGIVHRDLKPSNIFLSRREDGSPWAKVLDFGIAKLALAGAADATNTTLVGTPLYMAPEQMRANHRVGPPADRYALAQLTYRLLVGVPYWDEERREAENVISLLMTIGRGVREPATARAARCGVTLPPAFDAWFARAAARRREKRYPDAASMIVELARALGEAMPPSRGRPSFVDELRGPSSVTPSSAAPSSATPSSAAPSSVTTPSSAAPSSAAPSSAAPSSVTPSSAAPSSAAPSSFTPTSTLPEGMLSIKAAEPALATREVSGGTSSAAPARRPWLFVLAGVAVAALIGFAGIRATRGKADASASGDASARPTTLTDLPAPSSTSAAAISAYRSGLQEARDGIVVLAGFERALELDPTLPEAHLQLAARGIYEVDERARIHFREAQLRRTALSPRDRALLETIEPIVAREPSDWAEASRRAAAATERYPSDAQFWLVRGYLAHGDSSELAHQHSTRALELDPGYGDALSNDAEALAYLGAFDEATRRLDACAELTGSAYSGCSFLQFEIDAQQGSCVALEARARRAIAGGVQLDEVHEYLARSLAARAAPGLAVREALRASVRAAPPAIRRYTELSGAVRLALLEGDFVAAERDARAFLELVEPEKREDEHGVPTQWLAQALAESGRGEDAGRAALAFLDRSAAWEPDPRAEDYAMARDRTPQLLAMARDGGQLGRAEAASRRDVWLRRWNDRALPGFRRFLWMHAFPALAAGPDDAREVLAMASGYDALPAFRPKTLAVADIGHALLLAGRTAEAISRLEEATRSCRALEHPVLHTRAHDWLGTAREAMGDRASACAAYQVVIDRWGNAKPRSITADHARERMRALDCSRANGGR
jgi:serine/threonine-protein kinase